jgi:cyclohexa-1,5-dienecarbonyl-CoA hydratase
VTSSGGITLSRSAGNARIDVALAIPPVNVLSAASLDALARTLRAAAPARLTVLSGLPRAFSAGVDVAEHAPEPVLIDRMLAAMRGVLEALVETDTVTLASVSGACLGGGAEIVAACDLVLVAEDARIGFPEIRLACFPPGAAALLPARIGEARAAEWILTGRVFSGREAAEAGFASRAVPRGSLSAETEALAARILSAAPSALAAARDTLRRPRRDALASRLAAAEAAYRALAGDPDLERAVREFGASKSR